MSSYVGTITLTGRPWSSFKLDKNVLSTLIAPEMDGRVLGSDPVQVKREQQDTEQRSGEPADDSLAETLAAEGKSRYRTYDTYPLDGYYHDGTRGTRKLLIELLTPYDSHLGTSKKPYASAKGSNGELMSIGKYIQKNQYAWKALSRQPVSIETSGLIDKYTQQSKDAWEFISRKLHEAPDTQSSFTYEFKPGVIHSSFDASNVPVDGPTSSEGKSWVWTTPISLHFTLEPPVPAPIPDGIYTIPETEE